MRINGENGNPIDSRTARHLYRLKYGRKEKMFNDTELERLQSYLIPTDEDEKAKRNRSDSTYADKKEGYYYCATAIAV